MAVTVVLSSLAAAAVASVAVAAVEVGARLPLGERAAGAATVASVVVAAAGAGAARGGGAGGWAAAGWAAGACVSLAARCWHGRTVGGGGVARAFGVVLEHERAGIVWDGIALIGAFTSRFSPKYFDAEHFHSQFRSRGTELAVLMFGGNDLNGFSAERYEATMGSMLGMVRSADPTTACLVISIVDHGERKGARIVSRPQVASMVALQRRAALKAGCGYFNAYEAMGGEGSMGRWNRSSPRLGSGDLAHLTHHGHQVLGELFTKALLAAYADFREERVGAALPLPPAVEDEAPVDPREDTPSTTSRDGDPR